jgi:hypothetical protein
MNERQERDHAGTQIVGTVLDEASSFDRIAHTVLVLCCGSLCKQGRLKDVPVGCLLYRMYRYIQIHNCFAGDEER